MQCVLTARTMPQCLILPIVKYVNNFTGRNKLTELCNNTEQSKDIDKNCHSGIQQHAHYLSQATHCTVQDSGKREIFFWPQIIIVLLLTSQ